MKKDLSMNDIVYEKKVEADIGGSDQWKIEDILNEFKKDISGPAKNFQNSFDESFAQQVICKRGQAVLKPLITYIREGNIGHDLVVVIGFNLLLRTIAYSASKKRPEKNINPTMTDDWIDWVEKFV